MPQSELIHSFLELRENMPVTVYVRYFPQPTGSGTTKDKVGFAIEPTGPYFLSGIQWYNVPPSGDITALTEVDVGSAKFLLLALESPVNGVKCDLRYSPTFKHDAAPLALQMCVPSGHFKAEYHFEVTIKDPELGTTRRLEGIDPKIVVTPIT